MTPKKVEFTESATQEVREAFHWYAAQSTEAAGRFKRALAAAVQQIRRDPVRWPKYTSRTRYVLLKRFPYLVIYRVRRVTIEIIAVAHGRRGPGYRRKRSK